MGDGRICPQDRFPWHTLALAASLKLRTVLQDLRVCTTAGVSQSQYVLPQSSSSLEKQFILCNQTSKRSGDFLFEAWPAYQPYLLILISLPQNNWQECSLYQMRSRTLPFISLPIYHLPVILLAVGSDISPTLFWWLYRPLILDLSRW
jgi:hypothetical protein